MEDLRKDLQGFDEPRPRAVEELIAVGDKYPSLAHCPQVFPSRMGFQTGHFHVSLGQIEAARHSDDDVRIALAQLLPGHPGRMFACIAKEIMTTTERDEFGDPVTRRHQR